MVKSKSLNCITDYKNCPIGIMMNEKIDQINKNLTEVNDKLQKIDKCLQTDHDFRIISEPIIIDLKTTVAQHSAFILALKTTTKNFQVLIAVFLPSGVYSIVELIRFIKDLL